MSTLATYVAPIREAVQEVKRAEAALEQARERRDLRIVTGLRAGLTLEEAARVAGMSYGNVRAIAARRGVSLLGRRRR